jgi:hypothetical protein
MRYKQWAVLVGLLLSSAALAATLAERLKELKETREQGLIDEAEYQKRKQQILDNHAGATEPPATLAKPSWICTYSSGALDSSTEQNLLSFDESASAPQIVREILDAVGLAPNFVVRAANVPNAAATIFGQDRYVLYQPSFIASLKSGTGTNWAVYSVLAHEIGHHVQGHTIQAGGSRPPTELEADEFSGRVLFEVGATLAQAQAAMNQFGSEHSTSTHPAKRDRLAAIEKGWAAGKKRRGSTTTVASPSPQPPTTVAKPTLTACTHKMPCTHATACQHVMACQHAVPCQHSMPCQHPMMTPMGPVAMHPYDTIHPADAAHPADMMHMADQQHPFDLLHPEGDAVATEVP